MGALPRLAVGTIQSGVDPRPGLWALLEALVQCDLQVQEYLSRACFCGYLDGAPLTGLSPRYLDSWLMSPEVCRETFLRTAAGCDLAVVEGVLGPASAEGCGGRLSTLCQWLDLPRVALVDVSCFAACRWPPRPAEIDALLLDRVLRPGDCERLATEIQSLWGIPVLGVLEELPLLRAEVTALADGVRPSRELCQELGRQFLRRGQVPRLLELAARREVHWSPRAAAHATWYGSPVVIALAYDEAFNCYFPETLDALESRGATVVDFSPLRDDRLPHRTDIVYLGDGHPERFAQALAQNHCMKLALRDHVRSGGRLYAEGGGLAYLCEELITAEQGRRTMGGILPAVAHWRPANAPPTALEVTLNRPTWLGPRGTVVRGYQTQQWHIEPSGALIGYVSQPSARFEVMGVAQAIGSQLHLNFAAQPHLLSGFFEQPACRRAVSSPYFAP